MASSDDSTIAESCATFARACSSAEMSVSVSTTPSGATGGARRLAFGDDAAVLPLLLSARYGRMRRK